MATLTVYPDANIETKTVDGTVSVTGHDTIWSDIVADPGSNANDYYSDNYLIRIVSHTTTEHWSVLYRAIFLFDTSSLGSGVTITASTLSLCGNGKSDGININPNVDIYTSAPASNIALVAGDFDSLGIISQTGSPITYTNWLRNLYNDFVFNATGLGSISKIGISKFGARNANYDASGVAPTWVSNQDSYLFLYYAETTGTTYDPKLVITYTAGAGVSVGWLTA